MRDVGLKVLVYVSPLYPPANEEVEAGLSDFGKSVRKQFWSLCSNSEIKCVAAPVIPDSKKWPWWDFTHPPAGPLGQFIATALTANDLLD